MVLTSVRPTIIHPLVCHVCSGVTGMYRWDMSEYLLILDCVPTSLGTELRRRRRFTVPRKEIHYILLKALLRRVKLTTISEDSRRLWKYFLRFAPYNKTSARAQLFVFFFYIVQVVHKIMETARTMLHRCPKPKENTMVFE